LSSVQVVSDSGEAEHYKELAVKSKVEKDYYGAYQNYTKSAQILARGTKYDQIEAAATYEEAYKCANESEKKFEALKLAAKLFDANDSSVRAARIYERIGEMYSSRMEGAFSSTSSSVMSRNDRSTEAIDAFKRAIDCFKAQNDTRYLSIMTKMANSQCEAGKFEEAIVTLEEYFGSPDQRGASYELKKPFLTLGFCYLALNDPVRAQKWLHDFVDSKHPSLSQEREYRFLLGVIQGQMDNNSILLDETISEYRNLQPISDKWKQNVLDKARMDLDKDELT
jgi:tetratricopeptide (TPR) repeat protein